MANIMIEFSLLLKIDRQLSLNNIYSGLHWTKRTQLAKEIHRLVKLSLISQKIKKELFRNPVIITFNWNYKLDLDNYGFAAKLIIDGLKGYLLYDDNKRYIKRIIHQYSDDDIIRVLINEVDSEKDE